MLLKANDSCGWTAKLKSEAVLDVNGEKEHQPCFPGILMSVNKESKIDLILQGNSFNIIWDAIIISSVTFIVLLLPLHLIFNLWSENVFVTASSIFTLLFTIDMIVNIGQSRATKKLPF